MAWKPLSRPTTGLDVGSYSVKLLARMPGSGPEQYRAAEAPVPGARPESPPAPDKLAAAITDCLARAGLTLHSAGRIAVGISGPQVVVKQILLPLMQEREVGQALRFEARKHVPFDPQSMVMDHQVLGRDTEDRRLQVLMAAVSEEHIERHLAPFRALGTEPDCLDATPLALSNAILQAHDPAGEARTLLDIGYTSSHLTLYQPGEQYFTRRLDFGGHHLTRAIAAARGISLERAEELKLDAAGAGAGPDGSWDRPEQLAMLDCLRDDLMAELRRSLAFYRTIGPLPDPLSLWISGGSARLAGLAARLSELLGSAARVFDPLVPLRDRMLGSIEASDGPQFAQAFGLALRNA
jgi:type IV pilus assembly protein PilM